jgi:phosphopantothenoylcysteine decarboxylase/phosphopantothenate--cysteine ligase
VENARNKLLAKHLDVIVANDITQRNVGFDFDTNAVTILTRATEDALQLPLMSKREIADRILDVVVRLRSETGISTASST